jgi:hypothetical protein
LVLIGDCGLRIGGLPIAASQSSIQSAILNPNPQSPIRRSAIRNPQYAIDARSLRFFVIFFERRERARRFAQRFTMIVERKVPNVEGERAARRLLLDDDGNRAAFDAVAETDCASASETRVPESLQHPESDSTTGSPEGPRDRQP